MSFSTFLDIWNEAKKLRYVTRINEKLKLMENGIKCNYSLTIKHKQQPLYHCHRHHDDIPQSTS